MKSVIFFIFFPVLFYSCVSQNFVSQEEYDTIPKGSEVIEVYSEQNSDSLFKQVYSLLIESGFRIDTQNKEMHSISSEGKDVGQSTLGRFNIFIKDSHKGSLLTIRTEWMPGANAQMMAGAMSGLKIYTQWSTARFGDKGRPEFTFLYGVHFAKKISGSVKYR